MPWRGRKNNVKIKYWHLEMNKTMKQVIIDSNIIIYSIEDEYQSLREFLLNYDLQASEISKVEVLGFTKLTNKAKSELEDMFDILTTYSVSSAIINMATQLRQQKKMSLGDAIIASTALVYKLPLMTRNVADFHWIDELEVINPFDEINEK